MNHDYCPVENPEDDIDVRVVNRDLSKEWFQTEKLYCSVFYPAREADHGEDRAEEIADKVVYEVKAWMGEHRDNVFTTQEIEDKVVHILERIDGDVGFLYSSHLDLN
jgi:transcriptional regulator NrdR family protein